ncbi:uncharacterized protein EV422DRAFT_502630 [Fimicolochytrium jonesii]|uniref:uncharacterized protein n=1 Tax=Fimicolochytrium jonesii TaxID=1396493 RepID=UPI0022FDE099|nr:uncharacterized protein EV422DRAFT_502630 [Fimicolochytrium jonesii]KAI8826900.1 hypothetical protein EV422DRAFT_502630 [Fimicolochytrium jonesii]
MPATRGKIRERNRASRRVRPLQIANATALPTQHAVALPTQHPLPLPTQHALPLPIQHALAHDDDGLDGMDVCNGNDIHIENDEDINPSKSDDNDGMDGMEVCDGNDIHIEHDVDINPSKSDQCSFRCDSGIGGEGHGQKHMDDPLFHRGYTPEMDVSPENDIPSYKYVGINPSQTFQPDEDASDMATNDYVPPGAPNNDLTPSRHASSESGASVSDSSDGPWPYLRKTEIIEEQDADGRTVSRTSVTTEVLTPEPVDNTRSIIHQHHLQQGDVSPISYSSVRPVSQVAPELDATMSQSIIVAIAEDREPASGYFANAARKAWDVTSSTAGIISRRPSGQPKTPDDIAAGLREYYRGAGAIMTLDTTAHLLILGLDQYTGTDQESYLRVPITGVSTPTADPPTVAEKNLTLSMKMFATAQASRRVALLNVFISWTEFKSSLVELYEQINSRPPKKNEVSDWLKLYLRGRPELLYTLVEHAGLTDRLPQRPPPPQHLPLLGPVTPSISSHGDINPDWPSISLAAERRMDEVIQDVVKNMTDLARKGSHYAFLMASLSQPS